MWDENMLECARVYSFLVPCKETTCAQMEESGESERGGRHLLMRRRDRKTKTMCDDGGYRKNRLSETILLLVI
jgi:hypothetical protein